MKGFFFKGVSCVRRQCLVLCIMISAVAFCGFPVAHSENSFKCKKNLIVVMLTTCPWSLFLPLRPVDGLYASALYTPWKLKRAVYYKGRNTKCWCRIKCKYKTEAWPQTSGPHCMFQTGGIKECCDAAGYCSTWSSSLTDCNWFWNISLKRILIKINVQHNTLFFSYSSGGEDGYVRIHYFDPQYFDFELEA